MSLLREILKEANEQEDPNVSMEFDLGDESHDEDPDSVEKDVVGHVDDEPEMVGDALQHIADYAQELQSMLADMDDEDFPHWWQEKIIVAKHNIDKAKHYLEAKLQDR